MFDDLNVGACDGQFTNLCQICAWLIHPLDPNAERAARPRKLQLGRVTPFYYSKADNMRNAIKALYRSIPFKQQLFTALRRIPLSIALMRHLRFAGIINVQVDATHSFLMHNYETFIENDLFWRGYGRGWEGMSLRIWRRLARHAHSILDIGANTGVYSLAAKCVNPAATIVAFEPVERVYRRL